MLAHIPPSALRFAPWLVEELLLSTLHRLSVRGWCPSSPAMTESPFAPLRRYLAEGPVTRDLDGHYPIVIAPTGSCARPHPSSFLWWSLGPEVCAGCGEPLLRYGPSRRYSANLSLDAWTYTPAVPLVLLPVSSQRTAAFTVSRTARHSTPSVQRLPYGRYDGAAVIR